MKLLSVAALVLLVIFAVASANPMRTRQNLLHPRMNHTYTIIEPSSHRYRRAAGACEVTKELKQVVEKTTDKNGRTKYLINSDLALQLLESESLPESDIAESQFKNTLKKLVLEKKAKLNGDRQSKFLGDFDISQSAYDQLNPVSGSDGAPSDSHQALDQSASRVQNRIGPAPGSDVVTRPTGGTSFDSPGSVRVLDRNGNPIIQDEITGRNNDGDILGKEEPSDRLPVGQRASETQDSLTRTDFHESLGGRQMPEASHPSETGVRPPIITEAEKLKPKIIDRVALPEGHGAPKPTGKNRG